MFRHSWRSTQMPPSSPLSRSRRNSIAVALREPLAPASFSTRLQSPHCEIDLCLYLLPSYRTYMHIVVDAPYLQVAQASICILHLYARFVKGFGNFFRVYLNLPHNQKSEQGRPCSLF